MGFYYFSIFSLIPLAIAYGVVVLVILGASRFLRNVALLIPIAAILLILPITEELWIAWNFSQVCKNDGTVIYKKVHVKGFYDSTTHWWRQLLESEYDFVESRDNVDGKQWRVERTEGAIRHFLIDKPTAKYHFSIDGGSVAGHKIGVQSATVVDSETGEVLARHTSFHREAPWFFVSPGSPNMGCGRPKSRKHGFLIYREVLLPLRSERLQ